MRNLLHKTLKQFAICTIICFVLTAPLFYLLTKNFYAEDMLDIIKAVEQGQGIPPLDLERDIITGMMLQFLLIFIAISLSLFITMRFVTRRLWLPFDDTLRKAEQFNLAQDDIPAFIGTDISEFARLNRSLELIMRKDKETYRIQKEFSENASHELQTPLAIIRGKLDLLIQQDLTERQMQLVDDIYRMTTRMEHLNRDLLLLAKIDNAQYTATEEVDIYALLSDSLPLYDVLQYGVPLNLTDRRNRPHTRIHANPVLLECLMKNLIVNAIRHTAPDRGIVDIIVEDKCLTVSNLSAEKVPLDESSLFNRFHTGNTHHKGNGLGLAIVKSICDFHGWTVEYLFENNRHRFIISFHPEPA